MKMMRIRMKVMGIRNTAFCHLRIDGDQDPDPGYQFEGNPDPTFECAADPQQFIWLVIGILMCIQIQFITLMRIRILPMQCNADP